MPGFHAGRPPHNQGLRYPADPPKVEEIIAVMRAAGDDAHGRRLRGLIVILWRAGPRTSRDRTPGVHAKQNRGNRGGNERVSWVLSSHLAGSPRERTGRHGRAFQALSTGSIPVARFER
jgi:hypothetical protein